MSVQVPYALSTDMSTVQYSASLSRPLSAGVTTFASTMLTARLCWLYALYVDVQKALDLRSGWNASQAISDDRSKVACRFGGL